MIAKQSIGKSFGGALNYNLKKVYGAEIKNRAELLATNFLSLKPSDIKKELAIMKALNPNLKRNTYHTSLNFAMGENISNEKMETIAKEYLEKMGFDDNAYFIFRHHDADHPHCHILSLRNKFDGSVVSDSNNYARSETIVRILEEKHCLKKVTDSKQAANKSPNRDELEMVSRTGKGSEKMLMQERVALALSIAKNMSQFIFQLERSGISLLFNQASTGRVSGITFLSQNFKARGQALGNQFKWANILTKVDYEQTRDGKEISQTNDRTRERYPRTIAGADHSSERIDRVAAANTEKHQGVNGTSSQNGVFLERTSNGGTQEGGFSYPERSTSGESIKGATKNGDGIENNIFYDSNPHGVVNRNNFFNVNLSLADDEDASKKRKRKR